MIDMMRSVRCQFVTASETVMSQGAISTIDFFTLRGGRRGGWVKWTKCQLRVSCLCRFFFASVAQSPLPWAAASLTRASARWARCRASRPRPPTSTPLARDALLSSRRLPPAPRLGFSGSFLRPTLGSLQSNAECAYERPSMACRVRHLVGRPRLLGRR